VSDAESETVNPAAEIARVNAFLGETSSIRRMTYDVELELS
jgi:hypothetical protein